MDHDSKQFVQGGIERRKLVISKMCLKGSHPMQKNKEMLIGNLCVVAGLPSH